MPRLTIVIVTYNSVRHIGACLTSLTANPPVVEHDTIVVDNATQDGTSDLVRREWPGVRVIEAGRNLGFAAANNLGIRQTSGELVLLLNPDTVIPAGRSMRSSRASMAATTPPSSARVLSVRTTAWSSRSGR